MDRIFKPLFSLIGALSPARQSCQSLFCLTKNQFCTGRLGRRAVGRQAKGFLWRRSGKIIAPSGNIAAHLEGLYKLVEEQAPILIATPAALLQKVIVVEGAPLLRVYGSKAHRGFESLSPPVRLPS